MSDVAAAGRRYAENLRRLGGGAERVRWLRRDPHDEDTSCWLHGEDTCVSDREDEP